MCIRDSYTTGKKDNVQVFTGKEVEHTPALGLQTLFLARNDLTFEEIVTLADKVKAKAIYYGANRTFIPDIQDQPLQIKKLLKKGYYVTIDYQYNIHEEVKQNFKNVWNHKNFIPFCSIIFADTDKDKQLYFKIDDIDFNKTNSGVWAKSMKSLKESAGYTKWSQYKKDKPIKFEKDAEIEGYYLSGDGTIETLYKKKIGLSI